MLCHHTCMVSEFLFRGQQRRRGGLDSNMVPAGGGRAGSGSFETGDKVEVRSDEEGFVGVWYSGEVVHVEGGRGARGRGRGRGRASASASACASPGTVIVEYDQLLDEQGCPLQETAPLRNLRPPPPPLPKSTWLKGDRVEAFDKDGWWEGIVTRSLAKEGPILVYFYSTGEEIGFPPSRLRRHQCWQDCTWTDLTRARPEWQLGNSSEASDLSPSPKKKGRGSKRKAPSLPPSAEVPERMQQQEKLKTLDPIAMQKTSEAETNNCEQLLSPRNNFIDAGQTAIIALCAETVNNRFESAKSTLKDEARRGGSRETSSTRVTPSKSRDYDHTDATAFSEESNKHQESEFGRCDSTKAIDDGRWIAKRWSHVRPVGGKQPDTGHSAYAATWASSKGNNRNGYLNHCQEEKHPEKTRRLEYDAYRLLLQALRSKGSLDWKQELLLTEVRCQLEITNTEHACALKEILLSKEVPHGPPAQHA